MSVNWGLAGPEADNLGYVVEYGTGPIPADQTCNDADSATGWTTDPSTTPGASAGTYPAITMVRIHALRPLEVGEGISAWISLRALDTVQTGDVLVAKSSYSSWPIGDPWSPDNSNWNYTPYDPADHQGDSVHWGDRLGVAEKTVLTTKTVVGGDPGPLKPGDEVTFKITATPMGSTAASVTMTDTLPAGLELVSSDVVPDPSSTATTLVWAWGSTPRSTTRSVTYTTRVAAGTPNSSTLVNQVHTDVPDLAPVGNVTDAAASVRTSSDFIQLDVWKTTTTPTVEVGDDYSYTVSSANTANVDLTNARWIDVLPFNGDTRTPATSFTGSTRLTSTTLSAGATLEYTAAPSASIDADPDAASNQPGGSTTWCSTVGSGTGCPATIAEVTALRIKKDLLVPAEKVDLELTFTPTANTAGDVYSNNVSGRDDQTPLLAVSEDVTVTVVSSTIRAVPVCADDASKYAGSTFVLSGPKGVSHAVAGDQAGSATWSGLHSGSYELTVTHPDGSTEVLTVDVQREAGASTVEVTFGAACVIATTTTTSAPVTTTTNPVVANNAGTTTTTTAAAPRTTSATATTIPSAARPADQGTSAPVGTLALTGGSTFALLALGFVSYLVGAALLRFVRRRRKVAPLG